MDDSWSEWALIQLDGPFYMPLPCRTLILGREECDIVIQSRGLERRQAVLSYDQTDRNFRLRDLAPYNATWLNEQKMGEHNLARLKHCDTLRFGNDSSIYQIRKVNCGSGKQRNCPAWAKPEVRLAECQGCIRGQELYHTCDLSQESDHGSAKKCTCKKRSSSLPSTNSKVPSVQVVPSNGRRYSEEVPMNNADVMSPASADSSPKPLCTSLSNASIHSNFSEDSLTARDRSPPKTLPTIQQENESIASDDVAATAVPGMLGIMGTTSGEKAWWESEQKSEKKKLNSTPNDTQIIPAENAKIPLKETKRAPKKVEHEECKEDKKPPAMAFTVDFGDDEKPKRSPKIGDSLSKFVPRHRRNHSLSRAEEIKSKPREKSEKPVKLITKPGPGGSKKIIQVPDTPKQKPPDELIEKPKPSVTHDSRGRKIHKIPAEKPLSPDRGSKNTINSSAQYLINKMFSSAPDAHAVFSTPEPPQVKTETQHEPALNKLVGRMQDEFVAQTLDSGYSGYPEEDTVSETGTYTIEKDEQVVDRKEVDRMFSILSDEEPLSPLDEGRGSDSPTSNQNCAWIREWAVQVARHQTPKKTDRLKPAGSSPTAPTPPYSSPVGTLSKPPVNAKAILSSSGESQTRPRRKLPTPPTKPQQVSDNSDSGDSPKAKEEHSNGGRKSDSSLEAEKFLRDAESVVAAMQMRVSQMEEQSSPVPGNRTPNSRRGAEASRKNSWSEDSSCSEIADANHALPMRFNRAFSLRRAQAQSQAATAGNKPASKVERKQSSAQRSSSNYARMKRSSESQGGSRHSVSSDREVNFSRSDGGRFSLRMHSQIPPKSRSSSKPANPATKKKEPPKRPNAPPRSGSSLSSKEVEFQNWKRRKEYDPMRAAQQGRKSGGKKTPPQQAVTDRMTVSVTNSGSLSSPPILRSASFHGTDGMISSPTRQKHSPYKTQSTQRQKPQENVTISRHSSKNSNISGLSSDYGDNEPPRARKSSLDESADRNFSRGSPASSSLRSKGKLEALDNLVFSTIYSLSSKLRLASISVLDKLKKQMSDDCDLFGKIEDTLYMVSQPESGAGDTPSPTRPLTTTLKNLRKVENTLVVLDEVLSIDLRDAPEAEASYLCKPWNGYEAEESC